MRNTVVPLVLMLLVVQLPGPVVARDLADTLVSVVGLDEQGQPQRQGMGVIIEESGVILTSASLLSRGQGGIVRTNSGTMYSMELINCDLFQDLALVKIEAEGLPKVKLGPPGSPQLRGKVTTGRRHGNRCVLQKVRVTRSHPFSPRLIFLKLEPNDPGMEPGAPIFNQLDELVGMLHSFGQDPENPKNVRLWLVRNQADLPKGGTGPKENAGLPLDRRAQVESVGYGSFWEGVAASLRQDWKVAKTKFTDTLDAKGNLAEAYYGRGVTRHRLGDDEGAMADLLEAARQLPGYALAFLWLGKVWQRLRNQKSAKEAYQRALDVVPDLSEAWFRLGVIYYQEDALSQARNCLEKATDDFPEAAHRWWYLGNIALKEHRPQDGLEAFTQATKSDPGFFEAYLDGGKLLLNDLGQPNEAAVWLKEAVRLKPGQALPRYYLALAYLTSWNRGGAWEQYFALRDMSPELAASLAITLERRL